MAELGDSAFGNQQQAEVGPVSILDMTPAELDRHMASPPKRTNMFLGTTPADVDDDWDGELEHSGKVYSKEDFPDL